MAEPGQIPTGVPFGDIVTVQTPKIDEMAQRIAQRQAMRMQYQEQENKDMQTTLGKELYKVRSIDAPQIYNQYGDLKNLNKRLLFDPSVANNPQKYNDIQTQRNMIFGQLMQSINDSVEQKNNATELVKERAKNPYAFADNVGQILNTHMNTPLSELHNTQFGDLRDLWGASRYQGPDFDFQKSIKTATGQPRQTYTTEAPVDASGLQTAMTPYKFTSSPAEFRSSLLGTIAGEHKAHDSAIRLWRQIPQEERERVNQAYTQMPAEKWQQMTGSAQPQNLDPGNPNSEADQYASYLAKRYAVEGNPEKGTPVFRTNMDEELKAKQANAVALEGYKQTHRIDLAKLKQGLKDKSDDEKDSALGTYFNVMHDEAVKRGQMHYSTPGGIPTAEYDIPVDPTLNNMFKRGTGKAEIEPDGYRTDATGTYIRPVFYSRITDKDGNVKIQRDPNGDPIVTESISQPVPASQFKISLGQKALSKKDEAKEMKGLKTGSGAPYNINGQKYSHKQLNDLGYSDAEIDQFISEGKIKQ